MKRLVIVGNGFDLAHGLNTSYKNFVDRNINKKSIKKYKEYVYSMHSDIKLHNDEEIKDTWFYFEQKFEELILWNLQ